MCEIIIGKYAELRASRVRMCNCALDDVFVYLQFAYAVKAERVLNNVDAR